jgi:hypothetical protein
LDFTGLVAVDPFDEGSGDTATDISENGYDGVITSGDWVDGVFGGAAEFTGGQSHMAAEGVFSALPNNALTIGAWFQILEHTTYEGVIGGSDPALGGCCQYRIMIEPGFQPFYDAGAHADQTVAGVLVENEVWYHYVMTIDTEVKIYLDGELVGEGVAAADPLPELATPLLVATGESAGTWPLIGYIDEVIVFDRALSEEEVNELRTDGLVVAMAVDARGKLPLQWASMKSAR